VFARILDKDKVLINIQSGILVVDLHLGWPFLDLAEDPLYYQAELSSQFKCSILCTLYTTCLRAVLLTPGFANQVI
jgi:hypothetical protein